MTYGPAAQEDALVPGAGGGGGDGVDGGGDEAHDGVGVVVELAKREVSGWLTGGVGREGGVDLDVEEEPYVLPSGRG